VPDLLIIRHGESEWNLERRWQGWLDSQLTRLGLEQARHRAAGLASNGFAPVCVHSSDLGRARRTAEIIADALATPVRFDDGFRERSGGDFEGCTADEIDERWPGVRDAWRRGEISCPPGGEDDDTVFARFDAALARAVEAGVPSVIVTHGGALRLVATRAGVPVEKLIPNLCGYWFRYDGDGLTHPEPIAPLDVPTKLPATE
jgi:broad specificity phosphatase PhoE